MTNNAISLKSLEERGRYARELRDSFERNQLNYWWVSASAKDADIFIQPKEYKEHLWEAFPTISRISVQADSEGYPSFGISGYHSFRTNDTKHKFEERGYNYHLHTSKKGKRGRWWLTKRFPNLETITNEFKGIEPLLFEKG